MARDVDGRAGRERCEGISYEDHCQLPWAHKVASVGSRGGSGGMQLFDSLCLSLSHRREGLEGVTEIEWLDSLGAGSESSGNEPAGEA
jgi:hypothetical protein